MKKEINTLIIALLFSIPAMSQDTTTIIESSYQKDTIVFRLNDFVGDIQWQKSFDNSNWENIENAVKDTLTIVFTIESYYRAEVTVGLCPPYYSDVAHLKDALDVDNDEDGFTENQGDCDDTNAEMFPGSPEICGDGIDQNCDGKDSICIETITDYDGNEYVVVQIGEQVWMAENLKTTHYNDGTVIPSTWSNNSDSYCWFDDNKEKYKDLYGALYNSYTVTTEKVCPVGWHVPSNTEWMAMVEYVWNNAGDIDNKVSLLKAKIGWPDEGIDKYGFMALPTGYKTQFFGFTDSKNGTVWWSNSVTSVGFISRYGIFMGNQGDEDIITTVTYMESDGRSIRCIKD